MMWTSVREGVRNARGEIGTIAFDAALILATTGRGGILAIVDQPPAGLDEKDRVDIARQRISSFGPEPVYSVSTEEVPTRRVPRELRGGHSEWIFHGLLPTDDVRLLGSSMLAVLAAIDGATLIARDGKLLAYGAVIPSRPAGSEGARTAAARELSNQGLVLKVSADGPIALFESGKMILET